MLLIIILNSSSISLLTRIIGITSKNILLSSLPLPNSGKESLKQNLNKELKILAKITYSIENQNTRILLRNFSKKITGDSKYLEKISSKILHIFNCFDFIDTNNFNIESDNKNKYSDFSELCEMHFIYRNTRFVRIKNGFSLSYKEQLINLDIFSSEFAISDTIISNLTITDIYAKKIITIENLTTFTYFNDPNAIIIYLGGYAGKAEIELIKKIHAFKPLKCYHIGDIDWGGFEILLNLIEKTNIKFKPLYMGI